MNFQKIAPIPRVSDLLDNSFKKARDKSAAKSIKGDRLEVQKQKQKLKFDVVHGELNLKLKKVIDEFPSFNVLPKFYIKLIDLTLDLDEIRQSLGMFQWANKQVNKLHRDYSKKINPCQKFDQLKVLENQFYGRISSVIGKLEGSINSLIEIRKVMRSYPDIKDLPTVCIYGFPNVGKSTLLNKLTGSKAKVASYAFTTKRINVGYIDKKVQIIDVPGTLAREDKLNKIEMQAELVLEEVADVLVYIFDLTETCGYSVEEQKRLYNKIKNKKKVLIYLSKTDLLEDFNFKEKYYSLEEIEVEIKKLI
jgi:nucleolar GTP-binding protein